MAGFFEASLDPSQPDSYDAIQRKRKLADALMKQGMDGAPIQHWTQGLAKVLNTAIGSYQNSKIDDEEKAGSAAFSKLLLGALNGDSSAPAMSGASGAATPSMASAGPSAPVPPGALTDAIQAAATKSGIDPAYLTRTAQLESSYGKNLQSPLSSAGGPFAFTNGTARQYGLADKNDPNASADAAARLALDNRGALAKALGRDPSNPELYLAHQQGAGGAGALLSNPQANVVDALMPVYGGNRTAALQAIRNNGGSPDMTAGQFAGKWTSKFGSATPAVQTTSPAQLGAIGYAPDAGQIAPAAAQAIASASQGTGAGQPQGAQGQLTPEMLQAFAQRNGMTPPDPTGGAALARPVPAQDPVLAATAARAANPQPGDQRIPLDQLRTGSAQYPALEGADVSSQGASPAGGAPMPSQAAPQDRGKALIAAALADPRLSPQQKQMALQMYTLTHKDDGVTTIDLGNSIGIMDKRGNIVRQIPKQKDATFGAIGEDQFGNKNYGWIDPNKQTTTPVQSPTAAQAGDAAIPPAPPGVDPKEWRKLKTEELANGGPKLTEAQTNANLFANRAQQAHKDISTLEGQGLQMRNAAADVAGKSDYLSPFSSMLRTPQGQQYENGKRNFVNAILRKESGAAIGAEEYKSAEKQYFPQPGDTPETVAQKRRQRELAIDGLRTAAGPAANKNVQPSTNDGWQEIAPGVRIREKK